MSVTKKITISIICFTFYFCCCVFGNTDSEYVTSSAPYDTSKTVIVDAGHGGLTNTTH